MKRMLATLILVQMAFWIPEAAHDLTGKRPSLSQLENDPYILIVQNSQQRQQNTLEREYYIIRTSSKEKKNAYLKSERLYEKVIHILLKRQLIPNAQTLVRSKIKPQYMAKKKVWSFSTMFLVYGNREELDAIYRKFTSLGIQRLSTIPSINFLNEKLIAQELFATAKQKVDDFLKDYPTFSIKSVSDIEIKGVTQNSDVIEMQLFQGSTQVELAQLQEVSQSSRDSKEAASMEMRVVFEIKIGDDKSTSNDEQDEDQGQQEEQSQQSQSDDSL